MVRAGNRPRWESLFRAKRRYVRVYRYHVSTVVRAPAPLLPPLLDLCTRLLPMLPAARVTTSPDVVDKSERRLDTLGGNVCSIAIKRTDGVWGLSIANSDTHGET